VGHFWKELDFCCYIRFSQNHIHAKHYWVRFTVNPQRSLTTQAPVSQRITVQIESSK
jgi:hypothetical protein